MPFVTRGKSRDTFPFRKSNMMQNQNNRKKIESLAHEFIENMKALDSEFFATVVITHNQQALVVSNDHPANAIMGIAASWNMPVSFDYAESLGVNKAGFVYSNGTKH